MAHARGLHICVWGAYAVMYPTYTDDGGSRPVACTGGGCSASLIVMSAHADIHTQTCMCIRVYTCCPHWHWRRRQCGSDCRPPPCCWIGLPAGPPAREWPAFTLCVRRRALPTGCTRTRTRARARSGPRIRAGIRPCAPDTDSTRRWRPPPPHSWPAPAHVCVFVCVYVRVCVCLRVTCNVCIDVCT